jgi:PAS domain S-box-containing protein
MTVPLSDYQLEKDDRSMPGNSQHKYDLVEAEKSRMVGNFASAIELYDLAISGAKTYKCLQGEAWGNELAAKFYLAWGKEKIAAIYMEEAYSCYSKLGASAKAIDLKEQYPLLLTNNLERQQIDSICSLDQEDGQNLDTNITCQNPQLSKSFVLLSAAVEASLDGIAIIEDNQLVYVNHSQAKMFGYTVSELKDKSWQCLHPQEQVEYISMTVFPILYEFKQWRGEVIAMRKDGSTFDEEITLSLLENGQLVCVSRNTSNQKAMELALRKSEENYIQMFANIPAALYQFQLFDNTPGKMNYISARFSEMFEIPSTRSLDDISILFTRVHPEDWESFYQSFQQATNNQQAWVWQGKLLTPSGVIKWIQGEARPTTTLDGLLVWDGMMIDITKLKTALHDRRQAQQDLHLTNERLELTIQELQSATHLKDEFLATMSHELRTPLNAILGMSEALQEEVFGSLSEEQLNSISIIEKSGDHLLALINDILDVSKISVGKLELNITKVALVDLCKSSLIFVNQQAIAKQIQIDTDLLTDITYLWIDERRMCQVLINLLNNAIKFTPSGGKVILSVQVAASQLSDQTKGACVCFSVIDTGIGIAQSDIPKLFQPFIQLDSNLNRKYTGTGLGLVIVKQIVELHDGYVSIDSKVGQGSCFSVTIPQKHLKPDQELTTEKINDLTVDLLTPPMPESPLILLVEDNEVNINTFSSYLTTQGYRILLAQNGQDAINFSQSYHPDLILMDIHLPDMNGIQAIKYICQQSKPVRIPIIALTAQTVVSDREQCLAAGANQYLTKPVKLRELRHTIQQYLNLN